MTKLTKECIIEIANNHSLTIENPDDYISLSTSNLIFKCGNNHEFVSDLKTIRDSKYFVCPECDKQEVKYVSNPPQKSGKRIIGFDQATQVFGISVFDDDKLVFFDALKFSGDIEERYVKIAKAVDNICKNWEPDLIIFEDIQLQGGAAGYNTYKILAGLLGIVKMIITKNNVKHSCVLNKVWQSYFNITGKDRGTQKLNVINKVKELFGIDVIDDIADAILIGKYGVIKSKPQPKDLF